MKLVVAIAVLALLPFAAVWADGPGAYRPRPSAPAPAVQAQEAYNAGVALIERAAREEQKPQARVDKIYERALSKFNAALRIDPAMYEALTYAGFANRKLGRYDRALEAYGEALRLQPDFAPAIEYQGEVFLGLNRIEDAKHNYFRLYATAPEQAEKLLAAMGKWIELRRQISQGADAAALDEFASWAAERAAVKTTPAASGRTPTGW